MTTSLFHLNFMGVLVASDRPYWGQSTQGLKLFGREIIFEDCGHGRLPKRQGRTDRVTDNILCVASRGKTKVSRKIQMPLGTITARDSCIHVVRARVITAVVPQYLASVACAYSSLTSPKRNI